MSLVNMCKKLCFLFTFFVATSAWASTPTLTIVLPQKELKPVHPFSFHKDRHPGQAFLFELLHGRMMTLDRRNEWQCRLCKAFPTSESGFSTRIESLGRKSHAVIDLEFSEQFRWGDGRAITAYDLRFAWLVSQHLGNDHQGRFFFDRIQEIEINKNHARSFSLVLKDDSYLFADWGEIIVLPHHLEESLWLKARKDSQAYLQISRYHTDPLNPGLYSGPYIVKQLNEDPKHPKTILSHNAHYGYKERPSQSIEIVRPDAKDSRDSFGSEKSRQRFAGLIPARQLWSAQEKKNIAEISVRNETNRVFRDSCTLEALAFNLRSPALRDLRARQALAHATDKDMIISSIYNNKAIPANNFIHPADPRFNSDFRFYDHSITKSIGLLVDAKWQLSTDSNKRAKFGRPLKLSIVSNRNRKRIKTAQYLAKEWEKLGIKTAVNIKGEQGFKKALQRKDYEDLLLVSLELPIATSYDALLSKTATPAIRNDYRGQNIFSWSDKKTEDLLTTLAKDWRKAARLAASHELQQQVMENLPLLPLFFKLESNTLVNASINFNSPGNQMPISHYIHEWKYLEEAQISPLMGKNPTLRKPI